jgi:hypothetical protein
MAKAETKAAGPADKTQEVRLEFVTEPDPIHALVQQVPAKIKTNADVKAVSEVAAKAVEHGKKPEAGLLGYDADTWRDIHERTAKGLVTQPEALKKNREDRAEARNKEKQRWRKLAKPLWEERSKKEVAQILEERTGEKFDTIYRNLKRPE